MQVTEALLPLLSAQPSSRIVNVASMAGKLKQLSPALQKEFSSPELTIPKLHELVRRFERDVRSNTYQKNGCGKSNYGLSKLAVIAATKVHSRHTRISRSTSAPDIATRI